MFAIITNEKQKAFEATATPEAAANVPQLCGICGRACRQMNDPEGANRALCQGCPLAAFCEEEPTETRTKEEITAAIIEWFEANEDEFNAAIEELDSYNGYLGDDRYYSMDELDELYSGTEPTEILRRAFYGYDEDTYNTDSHGNREYGAFNPNRDYFTYNGYGNLVSADYKDYSGHLDHWTIESMSENRRYIDTIDDNDELSELFDALEECDE